MAEADLTILINHIRGLVEGHRDLISSRCEIEFKMMVERLDFLRTIVGEFGMLKRNDNLFSEVEGQIMEALHKVRCSIDTSIAKSIEANNSRMSKFMSIAKCFSLSKEIKSIREGKVLPLSEHATNRYSLAAAEAYSAKKKRRKEEKLDNGYTLGSIAASQKY